MNRFTKLTLAVLFLLAAATSVILYPQIIGGSTLAAPPQRFGRPPGDYQQTCRDISFNGVVLQANCQKRDGHWRSTSLDYRQCHGTVFNDDGNLRCGEGGPNEGRGYEGRQGREGLPRGDYKLTCQNMRMEGNRLAAACQKRDGSWRNTSLDNAFQCRDVFNDNGHLRCTR